MNKFNLIFISTFLLLFIFSKKSYANPSDDAPYYPVTSIAADLKKDAHVVVRDCQETFEVSNASHAVHTVKYVYTILNGKGADAARVVAHHDPFQKITSLKGKLLDANGQVIRELKKSDIEDVSVSGLTGNNFHTDNRVKTAKMVYDRFPYTVIYEYTVKFNGILSYPTWLPQNEHVAVEHSTFNIIMPNDLQLHYKANNTAIKPSIDKTEKKTSYTWTIEDLPARKMEKYGPTFSEQFPIVYTAPSNFEIDGHAGKTESWEQFGQFFYTLNKGRDELSNDMQQKVAALTKGAKNDKEKIKRIYQYLQDNTRYISIQLGIGGWQTFDAEYVETNKFGDCKALTNFTKSMLKVAGIPSYVALVNAGSRKSDIRHEFPSNQFNHVILCVPSASDTVWLECTSQISPFNYLSDFTEDRYVLLCKPEGSELIRTPATDANQNTLDRKASLTINEDGAANIQATTQYTGSQQDHFRQAAKMLTPTEQEKWLRNRIDIPSFSINSYEFIEVSQTAPRVVLTLDLASTRYAAKAGKRLFIQPNVLNQYTHVPDEVSDRQFPIVLHQSWTDTDTITLNIPAGYTIETLPKETDLTDAEFGSYSSACSLNEDGTVTYIRQMTLHKGSYPAAHYEAFRDFKKAVVKADKQKIVLVKQE